MKKESLLNKIKKEDWYELAQRDHVPPLPVLNKIFKPRNIAQIYGHSVPWIIVWNNDRLGYFALKSKFDKCVSWVSDEFVKPKTRQRHLKKLTKLCDELREYVVKNFNDKMFEFKDNKLALKYYKTVTDIQGVATNYGLATWFSKDLSDKARLIIVKREFELSKQGYTVDQALAEMMIHKKITDYTKKQQALDKLSDFYLRNNKKITKQLDGKIDYFLKKYGWIGYDYTGPIMSREEVIKYIKQYKKEKSRKSNQKEIIEICKFRREEKSIFTGMQTLAFMKDVRNTTDDLVNYYIDLFFTKLSDHFKVDSYNLRFLWPHELEDALSSPSKPINLPNFKLSHLALLDIQDKSVFLRGQKAENIFDILTKEDENNNYEVKGTVAWSGVVKGRVKIVSNIDDADKIGKNDILLSPMTSPRIIIALHRCLAIVTDEGGLTCHAAIIARELKKPCIVGTKNATKVFKDGDMVEVNANKGIVRKLK